LSRGERAYVDYREINGPLVHFIHLALQKLGGTDEHAFRAMDLTLSGAVFFAVGCAFAEVAASRGDAPPRIRSRLAWGLAGWVVLGGGYLIYGWWDLAQRESFYDLFLLASIALQLAAQSPVDSPRRRRLALVALAGALTAMTWLGKPTCALFSAAQALGLALDDECPLDRKRGLAAFALGSALGAASIVALLARYGDVSAFVQIVFVEVPRHYRFIWNKSIVECYLAWGNAPRIHYAAATLAVGGVLVARRALPRRLSPILFVLALGLAIFFVQGKGFRYHLHPVTAATHLVWLAAAIVAVERFGARGGRRAAGLAAAGALVLAYQASVEAGMSQAMNFGSYADAHDRSARRYWMHFTGGDFFAWDMREAAAFIEGSTSPGDRVQTYGMDPYLLFLARRLSATPYLYGFELNVDAALEGGSGHRPSPDEAAWLRRRAGEHEAALLAHLERRPPAAFALIDGAPFSFPEDADVDFAAHCPRVSAWMKDRYRPSARFGHVRVWLRNDVDERRRAGASP
jgi:hypothetical protein